ncbi:MAG: hypothetical protein ACYC99_14685 [Candidatus Geothermincolia bacterium]
MASSDWAERLARGFAVLRGAMLILFSMVLIIAPERAMPGSSSEPARALALMIASRTILLGGGIGKHQVPPTSGVRPG